MANIVWPLSVVPDPSSFQSKLIKVAAIAPATGFSNQKLTPMSTNMMRFCLISSCVICSLPPDWSWRPGIIQYSDGSGLEFSGFGCVGPNPFGLWVGRGFYFIAFLELSDKNKKENMWISIFFSLNSWVILKMLSALPQTFSILPSNIMKKS